MCRKSDPHYLPVMNRRMRTWRARRGGGCVPSASVFVFPLLTSVHSACVRTSPGRRTDPPSSRRRPAAAPRRPPRRKLPPGLRGRKAASAECRSLRSPAQIWEPCRRFRSFSLSSSTSSFAPSSLDVALHFREASAASAPRCVTSQVTAASGCAQPVRGAVK